MPRTLIWFDSARDELVEALLYIAADNSDAALALSNQALETAEGLLANPLIGKAFPALGREYRSILVTPKYRLIYRVTDDTIVIVAFLNTIRHLKKAWKSKPRG